MSKNNITDMPYAQWLEEALRYITKLDVRSLVLSVTTEDGEIHSNYYNATMTDKLLLSGLIQQDAMLDSLEANGFIEFRDDEEDDNGETEE